MSLAKIIGDDQNWDEQIDTVLMGYRASTQASTRHSPYYYMIYQQHLRLPIDTELQMQDRSEDGEDDMDSEVIMRNSFN